MVQHLVERLDVAVILIGTTNSMSRELLPYAQVAEELDRIANEIARPTPNGAHHTAEKQSDHWVVPDRGGTLRTTFRISGHWCPLCQVDLSTLGDYDLLGEQLLNTTVGCYNYTVWFEIVNSDPLELTISKIPLQAGPTQCARNRHGDWTRKSYGRSRPGPRSTMALSPLVWPCGDRRQLACGWLLPKSGGVHASEDTA